MEKKYKLSIMAILYWVLGFLVNMNGLQISIGGRTITAFSFMLLVVVLVELGRWKHIYFYRDLNMPLVFFEILSLFTSLVNAFVLPDPWGTANFSSLIATVMGPLGLILFVKKDDRIQYRDTFLNGLRIGILTQSIFCVLQILFYFSTGQYLNRVIGIPSGKFYIYSFTDCITGIGWERAQLITVLLIGIVISEFRYIRLFYLALILLTGSRTALISVVAYYFVLFVVNAKVKRRFEKKDILYIGVMLVAVISMIPTASVYVNKTFWGILNAQHDASGMGHISYFANLPDLFKRVELGHLMFGYGSSSSGYPYTLFYHRYDYLNHAWTVESSLLAMLWSTGVVGLIIWIAWLIKMIKAMKAVNNRYFAFMCATCVGSITYTLFQNSVYIALIMMAVGGCESLHERVKENN